MNIAYITSEISPFVKVSAVADVSGSLTKNLSKNDNINKIKIFIPKYKKIDEKLSGKLTLKTQVEVENYNGVIITNIYSYKVENYPKIEYILIENKAYYNRDEIYGNYRNDYLDNLERYAFFSKATLETIKAIDFKPDIIHYNSWQTALIGVYIEELYKHDVSLKKAKKIYTTHDLSIQGLFSQELWYKLGLDRSLFVPDKMEFWGKINLEKAGLLYSDNIITVSEAYSKEILTEEFACGLEGVIRDRKNKLIGITNGIDFDIWNPKTDLYIENEYRYDIKSVENKFKYKDKFIKENKLISDKILTTFIGRFDTNRGFDLISEIIETLILKYSMNFVFMGQGLNKYENFIISLKNKYPNNILHIDNFENDYLHKTIVSADMILLPSKYDPCNLTQMRCQRYGTIPIAKNISGQKDTIINEETGFLFENSDENELLKTIEKAISIKNNNEKKWLDIMSNAMKKDFSWETIKEKYVNLYKNIINNG